MGDQDFPQTLGHFLEIKSKYSISSSRNLLWKKVMEAQAKRTWLGNWKQKVNTNIQGIKHHYSSPAIGRRNNTTKMAKRRRPQRAGQQVSRRVTTTLIERKLKTLKKLIPNADASMGLGGLFRETAEYISTLEMRVRLMQTMVDALSGSE